MEAWKNEEQAIENLLLSWLAGTIKALVHTDGSVQITPLAAN